MPRENAKIYCSAFQRQEPVIQDITAKINKAVGVQEKAAFAVELQEEAGMLISCSDYDKTSPDCENCRLIANLRKRTADLIIRAKKLA
ncbi:MAG TPA: hypothetical protein VJ112_01115 [Rhabdochlamydiaceae bacterium]|nr:hypothetical protein [Rhabdochlamydiaceae bacterium]